MKKISKITLFFAFALIMSLLFGPSSSDASAKPGIGCSLEIAVTEGTVPLEITYEVKTSIPGDPMVIFGDNKPNAVGRTGKHLYEATGSFVPKAIISKDGSMATTCRSYVTVHPVSTTAVGTQTPEPPAPPVGNNSAAVDGTSASITVTGDNNASNSITCGNDCEITINNYPTDQVPPVGPAGQPSNLDKIIALIKWLFSN